jgi:DNA topoisomerase I
VNNGRFGPYVLCNKKYVSVPKEYDVMTITLEEACGLIRKKRETEAASHLKSFEEDPDMEIRTGRFGPYIAYKGKNYHLPAAEAENVNGLTLEQCKAIIEKQPASGKRRTVRRTVRKKQ